MLLFSNKEGDMLKILILVGVVLVLAGTDTLAYAQDYEQYECVIYPASVHRFSPEKTELFEMDIDGKEKYGSIIFIDTKNNLGLFVPSAILDKINIESAMKETGGKISRDSDKKTFFLPRSRMMITMWEQEGQFIKVVLNTHMTSKNSALQSVFEYGYCKKAE